MAARGAKSDVYDRLAAIAIVDDVDFDTCRGCSWRGIRARRCRRSERST